MSDPILKNAERDFVVKATEAQAKAGAADVYPDAAGVKAYVGQFGSGLKKTEAVSVPDPDALTVAGLFTIDGSVSPAGTTSSVIVSHEGGTGSRANQLLQGNLGRDLWLRGQNIDETWRAWLRAYTQGNILGPVSQSGGVPTGALFEYGENANGSYLKLPDGTLLMSVRKNISGFSISAGSIVTFGTSNAFAYFPVTPVTLHGVSVDGCPTDSTGNQNLDTHIKSSQVSNDRWNFTVINNSSVTVDRVNHLSFFAKGRWYNA